MKPYHHALVSARLFGGEPDTYLPVHTAFDMSKMALGDMRHRAALHSVDHGLAVMRQAFPARIGATDLDAVCVQHIHDDHGFSVTLDTWLSYCDPPAWTVARRQPGRDLEGFLHSPEEACAERWGGTPENYADICAYYALPDMFSDHPLAPAISRNAFGIFFSETLFGAVRVIQRKDGRPYGVAVRDIGETLTLARYGHLRTLQDVLAEMKRADWMTGHRVARSRRRRIAQSGRADLFDDTDPRAPAEPGRARPARARETVRS